MNYQTGDYIRFHTPEQWQQIVEKLERDGEEIFDKKFIETYSYFNLLDSRKYWSRSEFKYFKSKRDITDKFFEEVLQDELCNNPPLEVGDELVVKWDTCEKEFKFKRLAGCNRYDIDWVDELGDTQYYTHNYDLEKLLNQDIIKILSYKQANPKQEYSVKPKAVPQVSWKELQETYAEFSIEQSKKFMENWLDRHIKITYCEDVGSELTEVENTFNNILTVNRKCDYVETVSVFSDHSEATFYYWKDCEVVGDVTLNKIELQHYLERLQKMLSDMD